MQILRLQECRIFLRFHVIFTNRIIEAKIFHAGDTGLFSDMRFVVGDIYKPDIALLPVETYSQWASMKQQ